MSQGQSEEQIYTFPDDGFSVALPAEPVIEHDTRTTPVGDIQITTFEVKIKGGLILIIANHYAKNTIFTAPKAMLDMSAKFFAEGYEEGEVLWSERLTFMGYPAMDALGLVGDGADRGRFRMRTILVENRMYMLIVGDLAKSAFKHLTDSFTLLGL